MQLTRRYDLIPNLVETAKGYLRHERETFPSSVVAGSFGFAPAQLLELPRPEMREAPRLSFG